MAIFSGQTKKRPSELELASYLVKKEEELKKKEEELKEEKEKIAGLSKEEARKIILEETAKKLASEISKKIKEAEEEVKASAQEKAKEILVEAMKHGAVDWTAEYTVSTIRLPDEEIKGRIIGREGRNIRTFEQATGVEIELDETLDLRLSSFDPVRREIARLALEKLIKDGRIQPGRVEEVVAMTKEQMDTILIDEGKKLCHSVGVYNLHLDLVKMLGRYKFRFSYGQNMIIHTLEETKIGIAIAEELKADVNIVRLGCLLHDIGKVVTEEEGSHVQLGADLLKKYGLPKEVVECVAEHHEDKPFSSVDSAIVWVADAISGSRPGARYVPHEEYLKRMIHIEEVAKAFEGVEEVAAYQAGREVRVIVKPEMVSDDELTVLAKKISEKLEEDAKWAGQIKVVVIRETRATEVAK
jgi:ribonuclease Y